jgi:hypothetical protein
MAEAVRELHVSLHDCSFKQAASYFVTLQLTGPASLNQKLKTDVSEPNVRPQFRRTAFIFSLPQSTVDQLPAISLKLEAFASPPGTGERKHDLYASYSLRLADLASKLLDVRHLHAVGACLTCLPGHGFR